jgi:hypothetical protein
MKQAPGGTDSAVDRWLLTQVISHRLHLTGRNMVMRNPSANERLGAGVKDPADTLTLPVQFATFL